MLKNYLKNGFSIVDLIAIVSGLGLLCALIIPYFLRFTVRARQSNAKVELSDLYTAQQNFLKEYKRYHYILPYVGFIPDGIPLLANGCPTKDQNQWLRRFYQTGFSTAIEISNYPAVKNGPKRKCTAEESNLAYYPRTTGKVFKIEGSLYSHPRNRSVGTIFRYSPEIKPGFTAYSAGSLGSSGKNADLDLWSITEKKELHNQQPGVSQTLN